MKTQHTAGPWKVAAYNKKGLDNDVLDSNDRLIAEVNEWSDTHNNAQLIAAAPELLEALNLALGCIECLTMSDDTEYADDKKLIIAAISKAKGEL